MDNPPTNIYVVTSEFAKATKGASGGVPTMIMDELQENYNVIFSENARLTENQRDRLADLLNKRQEMLDQPLEMSDEDKDRILQKAIREAYDSEIMAARNRNRQKSDQEWKLLSKEEQEQIDKEIDEEYELTNPEPGKKMHPDNRAFRRADRLVPISDEQREQAQRNANQRGTTRANSEIAGDRQRRIEKRARIAEITDEELTAGAIALDQDATLLIRRAALKTLMDEAGGKTQDLTGLITQMQREQTLPQSIAFNENADDTRDRKQLKKKLTGFGRLRREIHAVFSNDAREKLNEKKQQMREISERRRATRERYLQWKQGEEPEQAPEKPKITVKIKNMDL